MEESTPEFKPVMHKVSRDELDDIRRLAVRISQPRTAYNPDQLFMANDVVSNNRLHAEEIKAAVDNIITR